LGVKIFLVIQQLAVQIDLGFIEKRQKISVNDSLTLVLLPLGSSFLGERQATHILVYQDLWITNQAFYIGLLSSRLGLSQRIHARSTKVIELDKTAFNTFCDQHHYLKTTNCKIRLGLYLEDELVMVAGFSKPRLMYREGQKFQSAEWIRASTKTGYTVVGGMTKLFRHFETTHQPDDVVTYIDYDYFGGAAYQKMGFYLYKDLVSTCNWLQLDTLVRFSTDQLLKNKVLSLTDQNLLGYVPKGYAPIHNLGTMKWVWERNRKNT
jgi:hypothetical protein